MSYFGCEPDNSDSTRGEFYWRGWLHGHLTNWTIECDNKCESCTAYAKDGDVYFVDKDDKEEVYEMCEDLPTSRPRPADTTNHDTEPTGKVLIGENSDRSAGHDSWRDHNYSDKRNYISLAIDSSTCFIVELADGIMEAYDSIVISIPSIAWNTLSFSKTSFENRKLLTSYSNWVTVFSKNIPTNMPISLKIEGIDDPTQPVCLAGDCYGSEDKLQVIIYEPKVYDQYRLYHHPDYTPTNDQFKKAFNDVLKQAVVEMGDQERFEQDRTNWDCNNNELLDFFPGYEFGQNIGNGCHDEFSEMIEDVGEMERCNGDDSGASFLIEHPIRQNWVLIRDPIPDGDGLVRFLELERVEDIGIMDTSISIGPFNRNDNHFDLIIINVDDENKTVMVGLRSDTITGIPNIFRAEDTITLYRNNAINGITKMSCSCSRSNLTWDTHIHEFLHQISSGRLSHVADPNETDNVMYPYKAGRTDTKLRYRSLYTNPGPDQQQWEKLHGK